MRLYVATSKLSPQFQLPGARARRSCRARRQSARAGCNSIMHGGKFVPGRLLGAVAHGVFVRLATGEHYVARLRQPNREVDSLRAVVHPPKIDALLATCFDKRTRYLSRDLL